MPLFSAEEWNKVQKEKRTLHRLKKRQQKLVENLRRWPHGCRQNHKFQTELRRVAALCMKLDTPLLSLLELEIIQSVHEI